MLVSSDNVPPKRTLAEKVKLKLSEILESSDLIKFVALVTMDGFTVSSVAKDHVDINPKWLGALVVSSIKNLENNLKKALNNATLSELVISLGQDILIIKSMGKLSLIMIADKMLDINFVMYEIEEGLHDLSVDLGVQ